ncbi:MAG: KH domain-containing protein [Nanoarchaeota archaeon]|nr:KH domain-containing protein [Nanoarchaeota archaeon]MBU1321967.1 KH domain-containing protein [Nanoarchaeota archaeon]MBU1598309.1 KH domain-containing protein [Nanoarchaeota archaeon]
MTAKKTKKQAEETPMDFDEDVYLYTVKIPKDRIAVLIGVNGKEKKELEDYSSAKIDIDSKEGDVTISGKDAIKLYTLKEVIKAIARGFNPELALLLLRPDYMLEIINLKDYGMDNKNKILRVKARIIGTKGKARRTMEELTGTLISVYGKTVGILGECTEVPNARRAIELLIQGSMHSTVFKWLENQRRKSRADEKGF